MPSSPKRPCPGAGCKQLIDGNARACPEHTRARRRADDQRRGSSTARGYGYRWQKASKVFLSLHPLCVMCEERGLSVPATVVDHIVPHKGDQGLFWDQTNWQGLCKTDHDTKTAAEDGGFGNERA